jgi:toxin YoeB
MGYVSYTVHGASPKSEKALGQRLRQPGSADRQKADPDTLHRINALLQDIRRNPFKGLGKPEPLRGDLSGWWSRRISGDHRIVYPLAGVGDEQQVEIVTCRYDYSTRRR